MSTIRLVPLGLEHLASIREIMRDPEVLRFTRTPDPMDDGWLLEWFARYDDDDRAAFAILESESESEGESEGEDVVGYAVAFSMSREDLEVELGYALGPQARGRGVATEALRLLTRWAFDEGMVRVVAGISVENPASSRVVEKVGYTFEGVLRSVHHVDGKRVDLQSWSILPGELSDDPTPAT
jgi:RimJ/RimL family protein N-acetyltransferase